MKMRISHSLMVLCLLFYVVPTLGQNINLDKKIELQLTDVSIKEAIKEVEKESGLSIAFNNQLLDKEDRYSWKFDNKSIKDVLDAILKPQGLNYRLAGNRILVFQTKTQESSNGPKKNQSGPPTLTGQVVDEETGEPIYFAHLLVEGTSLGTVANEEGKFKILIPDGFQGKSLLIRSMGYEQTSIPISNLDNGVIISLPPALVDIETITVTGEKIVVDPLQIVREAIQKIPENYPDNPVRLSTYYRELIKTNGVYTKFSDAASEIYYTSYQDSINHFLKSKKYNDYSGFSQSGTFPFNRATYYYPSYRDQVQIVEARASDNLQRYEELAFLENQWAIKFTQQSLARDIGGGPLRMTAYDHVKHLNHILESSKLRYYNFELIEITKDGNDYVYRIKFFPKRKKYKKSRYIGELVIDYKSKAFRKIEYTVPDFAKKRMKRLGFTVTLQLDRKFRKKQNINKKRFKAKTYTDDLHIQVAYFPYKGKWYLKRVSESFSYQNRFLKTGRSTYETRCDLVVNDIQLEEVDTILKKDQFRTIASNYLFQYPLSYNPEFWKTYPALMTDRITEEAIQDLEQTHSLEEQFASKFKYDSTLQAPQALEIPFTSNIHGEERIDPYHWLRDKYSDSTLTYLEEENKYTANYMIPHRAKQRQMYYEMVDKIEKDFETLPQKNGPYYYTYQYEEGLPYEIYYRRKGSMDAPAEVILDVNELAEANAYFSIDGINISPDNTILAYYENTSGGLENVVRFKDLNTANLLIDSLVDVSSMVWTEDSKTIYYTQADTTRRDYQVYRYTLNRNQKPELIFEETDSRFAIRLYKSKSKKYIILESGSKEENEQYLIENEERPIALNLIKERQAGRKVFVDHYDGQFYVFSNFENPDFALYQTDNLNNLRKGAWTSLINHASDTILNAYERVGEYLVLGESVNMHPHVRIINLNTQEDTIIEADQEELAFISAFTLYPEETEAIYLSYSSPLSPYKIYKYDLKTGKQDLTKERKILGPYNKGDYRTERIYAKSKDGTAIPVTIVYKELAEPLSDRPLHVQGYGAYGIDNSADFSVGHLPFLEKGGIIAYPHVRGGSEMGNCWYQSGKLLKKRNTIDDFISSVEFLIAQGFGNKEEVFASGGSAGGLLMGAVINERPDLFKAVVLKVPFVDVLNTMLDSSLTLTTLEYQEWGNPNEEPYYQYIKSYSPYDNIKAQEYPHLLFMSGFNDGVVGYWEAAKMVAKLRANKTDDNVLLLKTKMNAGHLGGSGRYEYYKNLSFMYTFFESLE